MMRKKILLPIILLSLLAVLILIGRGLTYILKPIHSLKNNDRLWNISDNVDISYYEKKSNSIEESNLIGNLDKKGGNGLINGVGSTSIVAIRNKQISRQKEQQPMYNKKKLVSEIELSNNDFKKIVKYAMSHNGSMILQEVSYNLEGQKILLKYPVRMLMFNSRIDVVTSLSNKGDKLVFNVEDVSLGKIKLPDNIVVGIVNRLKSTGYGNMRIEGKKIYLDFKSRKMTIKNISIRKGKILIKVYPKTGEPINIPKEIVDNLVQ